jgi:hypothetical protein
MEVIYPLVLVALLNSFWSLGARLRKYSIEKFWDGFQCGRTLLESARTYG